MKRWTLDEASVIPLTPVEQILNWGPTLVLSPHPDDEALGCGGVTALMRKAGIPVEIAWLTDGCKSHPNSIAYPKDKLVELRRSEAQASAAALGVKHTHFLELPDAQVPFPCDPSTVAKLREMLKRVKVVLTSWRLDPHCDHRAAYNYVLEAAKGLHIRIIEYPIWVWQNGSLEDHPQHSEFDMIRVPISEVLKQKNAAIDCHQSQISSLISDDPEGFCVPPEMLRHFRQPWELFIIPR